MSKSVKWVIMSRDDEDSAAYLCGARGTGISSDITDAALYVSEENAVEVAKKLTKTGLGNLFVAAVSFNVEIVKPVEVIQPAGFVIRFNVHSAVYQYLKPYKKTEVYYTGPKTAALNAGYLAARYTSYGHTNGATRFKTLTEAQKAATGIKASLVSCIQDSIDEETRYASRTARSSDIEARNERIKQYRQSSDLMANWFRCEVVQINEKQEIVAVEPFTIK